MPPMSLSRKEILSRSAGRDRVTDAVKALALALVMIGHGLAWTRKPDGSITNTLEAAPQLFVLTWVLQILPLFFLLAGAGLRGLINRQGAADYARRVERLVAPVLPLLLITLILVLVATPFVDDDIRDAIGLLPVQLTWFIAVYLLVIAAAPALARVHAPLHMLAWLAGIAVVDVLRFNVSEAIGWLNLFLVWALFAIIGLRFADVRKTNPTRLFAVAIACVAGAIALIVLGPYSAAMISTDAVPGASNLAPPTTVLALIGVAQTCLLALSWPRLERLLQRDGLWVPIAVFASRSMQLYLFHMLFLAIGIGIAISVGGAPSPLGPIWWLQHVLVFVGAIGATWLCAPALSAASSRLSAALSRLPRGAFELSAGQVRLAAALAGLALLTISEGGLAAPFSIRSVIGIPVIPIVSLTVIVVVLAATAATSKASATDESVPLK